MDENEVIAPSESENLEQLIVASEESDRPEEISPSESERLAQEEKAKKEAQERKTQQLKLIGDFIEVLPAAVGLETCKVNLRLTRDGVFVKEEFYRTILTSFQKWYQTLTSSAHLPNIIKVKRKLFAEEQVHQVYLIEGKTTLVGYLLPCETQSKRRLGLPYVDSRTLDAKDFLHSRDPLFSSLNDVDLVLKPGSSEIEVSVGSEKFRFTMETVKQFHAQARYSPIVLRRYRKLREAQRFALVALVKIIKQTRSHTDKKPLFIPVGTEHYPAQAFRLYYDWVFVLDERSFIRTAYELRGKNFSNYVASELRYLAERGIRGVRDLRIFRYPGREIADIRVGASSYKLGRRCLDAIEKFYPYYISKHAKGSKRYSLADLLKFFVAEFQQAYIVAPKEVAWLLKAGKVKAREFRFNKRWLFLINHKRVVFACLQVPGSYQKNEATKISPITRATVASSPEQDGEDVKS